MSDALIFNPTVLSRRTALAGLLRGELGRKAGISTQSIVNAFAGRPVGVRVARAIAKALGAELVELVKSENEPAASTAA
ncbi:MAG: helix-turn-helix transcriptional regulator [Planctomycetes bacterium]|nr:helix-turn-helix transcriptional regulator [Planctomycetota bacterium]